VSASYLVDLGGTTLLYPSLLPSQAQSGLVSPLSGVLIGNSVDMLHANSFCNAVITGINYNFSGQVQIQVQTSDTDVSGNYTDPTSGLAQFPTWFSSGGLLWINSGGLLGGTLQGAIFGGVAGGPAGASNAASGSPNSGYAIASGFTVAAGFQRIGRFVRANVLSGALNSGFGYNGPFSVSFISQLKITGSGGGYTPAPSSGAVNV